MCWALWALSSVNARPPVSSQHQTRPTALTQTFGLLRIHPSPHFLSFAAAHFSQLDVASQPISQLTRTCTLSHQRWSGYDGLWHTPRQEPDLSFLEAAFLTHIVTLRSENPLFYQNLLSQKQSSCSPLLFSMSRHTTPEVVGKWKSVTLVGVGAAAGHLLLRLSCPSKLLLSPFPQTHQREIVINIQNIQTKHFGS